MQPLHYDSSTSMLAQLRGRKRIKLYKSTPEVFRAMKLFPNSSPHRRRGAVRDLEESDIDDGDDALKPSPTREAARAADHPPGTAGKPLHTERG